MLAPQSLQLSAILILIGNESENLINDPVEIPNCGVIQKQAHSIQTRIVGGHESTSDAWPWQIAVFDRKKRLICGGTLISSEFVLTAAHCVAPGMRLYIKAGEFNLAEKEDYEQEKKVIRHFRHPQYDKKNVDNDIALLKLESPLELTRRVWPACLPEQNEELKPEVMGTILGWGVTSYHRLRDGKTQVEREDTLHEAKVPVADYDDCKESYGDILKSPHVICAGYKRGKIDSCAGDSGGPLLVQREDRWHVYGVTSFGEECGKEGKYGIYSKTSAYVDWIKRIIGKNRSSRTSIS